jgi:hypothetical protein
MSRGGEVNPIPILFFCLSSVVGSALERHALRSPYALGEEAICTHPLRKWGFRPAHNTNSCRRVVVPLTHDFSEPYVGLPLPLSPSPKKLILSVTMRYKEKTLLKTEADYEAK